jgi:hypothetical protein
MTFREPELGAGGKVPTSSPEPCSDSDPALRVFIGIEEAGATVVVVVVVEATAGPLLIRRSGVDIWLCNRGGRFRACLLDTLPPDADVDTEFDLGFVAGREVDVPVSLSAPWK